MVTPGHTTKDEPADAQIVSNGFDAVENIGNADETESGSPFDAYRLPTSNDQIHLAGLSSDSSKFLTDLSIDLGEPHIGQDRNPFFRFQAGWRRPSSASDGGRIPYHSGERCSLNSSDEAGRDLRRQSSKLDVLPLKVSAWMQSVGFKEAPQMQVILPHCSPAMAL